MSQPPLSDQVVFTFAAGQSVSDAQNLNQRVLLELWMPAAWTAAGLTLQQSRDGATGWSDVYDQDGGEVTLQAAAGRCIKLRPNTLLGAGFVRLRSGTGAAPVVQAVQRVITGVWRQVL